MVSKFFNHLLKGIFWGSTIFIFNAIVWDITDDPSIYLLHENFTFYAVGFLLFGIVIGISAILFEFEQLNDIQKTAIHASITTCAYLIIGFVFGWFSSFFQNRVIIAIIQFAVIYFVFWIINYISEKSQINRINAALKKRDRHK